MNAILLTIILAVLCVFPSPASAQRFFKGGTGEAKYWDGDSWEYARMDPSTKGAITIDNWYHEIITGNHYFLDGAFPLVASGVTKTFGVTAPSGTTVVHMVFALSSSGKTLFDMYEGESGSTFFNGGAAVTARNSNRGKADSSSLTIVAMPNHVVSGVSTPLFKKIYGTSGVNPANPGAPGSGSRDSKILFAPGKKYLVIFQSGAADNDMNYTAEWYEQVAQ